MRYLAVFEPAHQEKAQGATLQSSSQHTRKRHRERGNERVISLQGDAGNEQSDAVSCSTLQSLSKHTIKGAGSVAVLEPAHSREMQEMKSTMRYLAVPCNL
eukprot:1149279-Pelagomonas_calceolata.AAC.1